MNTRNIIRSISPLKALVLIFALLITATLATAFTQAPQPPAEPAFVEETTTLIRARLLEGQGTGVTAQVFTPVTLNWHTGDTILVVPSDDCHCHYDLSTSQHHLRAVILEDMIPSSHTP